MQAAAAEAKAEVAERERAKALEWLQGQLLAGGWGADGVMPVRDHALTNRQVGFRVSSACLAALITTSYASAGSVSGVRRIVC